MRYVIELDIEPEVATPQEIASAMEGALDSLELENGDMLYLNGAKVSIEEPKG